MKVLACAALSLAVAAALPAAAQEGQSSGLNKPAQGEQADSPAEQAPVAAGIPEASEPASSDQAATGFVAEQGPGELLASDLIGQSVYDSAGTPLGEVSDILIGSDHRLSAVILSVGGGEDGREKQVGIPFDALERNPGENREIRLLVDRDRQALETAESFEPLSEEASLDDNQDLTQEAEGSAKGGSVPPPQ